MTDRRRRQKENKAARKQAEKKAENRKEVFKRVGFAFAMGGSVVLLFLVVGWFGADSDSLPGTYEGYRSQVTACGSEPPPPETVVQFAAIEPQTDITPTSTVTATITTSCGDIVIELAAAASPETVESFVFLAREDFYDGTVFHRIADGFVVQGGDPEATGAGGPGYSISDEYPETGFTFETGVVAMANAGRGTTGSQFFIVIGDAASTLSPNYNILGRVVSGTETLEKISQVPTASQTGSREKSRPVETVYIENVEIEVG